jgi:hypothetical protein
MNKKLLQDITNYNNTNNNKQLIHMYLCGLVPKKMKKVQKIKSFSICTYNIYSDEKIAGCSKLSKRLPYIVDEIIKNNPDIICLQQVSQIAIEYFKTRKELTCNYLFFEVNTDIETSFVLSKYKPKTVLKRDINMSMIVIEFVNILIINIKLNENNKMEQIKYIKKMLDKYNKKNVILVGDLNFDYNIEDDLIKKELVQIGFVDTCYIDKYTYDTTVNKMCWNLTYTRNRIRNNVILYKTSKFKPDKIHLFGTQHVFSIDKNDAEVNKFITENNFDPRFIKLTNDKIPFWPSYSFGLAAQFTS